MSKQYREGCKAIHWEFGQSSKGNEQIAIRFEIPGGPPEGYPDTYYGTFTDKSREISEKAMKACGWDGFWSEDLRGMGSKVADLVFTEDDYGKKIAWVNEAGGGGIAMKAPLDASQKRSFVARMAAGRPAPSRPQPPPKRDDDDGIPF
jgi:hypothetical protein